MDVKGGHAAVKKIKEKRASVLASASDEAKNADRGGAKVVIINKAGHHVYLDGWEQFNQIMLEEMKQTREQK
jgi:cardiolipin-specific phospholipase